MMAFVADNQLKEDLVRQRDEHYKISSADKKKQREDIEEPKSDKGADACGRSRARRCN